MLDKVSICFNFIWTLLLYLDYATIVRLLKSAPEYFTYERICVRGWTRV